MFQDSALLPVPLPLLDGFTLVMLLFSLGKRDSQFRPTPNPIQFERYDRIAGPFR